MSFSKENRDLLEKYVAKKVGMLQSQFLKDVPSARAQLACLRRAIALEPGQAADTWEFEFVGLPDQLKGRGAENATPGEWAVHLAFSLYATHQQARTEEMHRRTKISDGELHGLGHAMHQFSEHVGRLNSGEQLAQGEFPKRFAALVTSESIQEVAHYARQLVQQLRDANIAVDYARLAGQLYEFQYEFMRSGVRLEWAREFSQWRTSEENANTGEQDQ